MGKLAGTEITAAGRLSKDGEQRFLSNGTELFQFGFFVNVEVTDAKEDLAALLVTGKNVLVRGPLNVRKYTDKEGYERLMFQVAGRDISIIDTATQEATPIGEAPAASPF